MQKTIFTTVGLALLMLWTQTLESVYLAHCVDAYNTSIAVSSCAAATLLACHAARSKGYRTHPVAIGLMGAAASITGAGSFFTSGNVAIALLGTHIMLCMPFIAMYGKCVCKLAPKTLFPTVCVAGLAASVSVPFCAANSLDVMRTLFAIAPAAYALCLVAAHFGANLSSTGDSSITGTASSSAVAVDTAASNTAHAFPSFSDMAGVLCFTLCALSVFIGIVANPFYANSNTSSYAMAAVAGAGIAGIVVAGGAAHHRKDYQQTSTVAVLQAGVGVALLAAVAGLFLFSTAAAGTMTLAVGVIMGARQMLFVIAWIVLPCVAAQNTQRVLGSFSLLILASGTIWATYLGAWVAKMSAFAFAELLNIALALITLVAVAAIAYLVFFIATQSGNTATSRRQFAWEVTTGAGHAESAGSITSRRASANDAPTSSHAVTTPASRQLTAEELKTELQRRRKLQLKPFGLTEREEQIVIMLLDGQTMKGVAEELFITERTVKFHSKNAYEKLGVASKKELMQRFSDLPAPQSEALTPH